VDHLFDRGFISFNNDGTLKVSRDAADVLTAWGIQVDRRYGGFTPTQRKYLAYHRKNVFERRRTHNR
jgi:hypothetical protein